jgi:hypothetical protein
VFDFKFFGTLGAYSPPNRYAFFSGYPFVDGQAFFEGSPFPEEQKVLRVNDKKGVWMWDVLSEQGYITYSARDMCSRYIPRRHRLSCLRARYQSPAPCCLR